MASSSLGRATSGAPPVLVVDDDEAARRLVRMGLELEGMAVIEAESVARARSVLHAGVQGVVLDRQLPDGDGLDLLADIGVTCPDANVVIHSTITDGREPTWAEKVDKGDLPSIVRALALTTASGDGRAHPLAVVDLVRAEADQVAHDWEELCRWDPLLPPDALPPLSRRVVDAIADALQRPQPLGWGPDPALAKVTELFAASAGAIDVAVGQLVCLREAFRRHVVGHVPPGEEAETQARVDMIIDRAIWSASRIAAARLERHLPFDPLTGLPNLQAFERDLDREVARAARYARPLSVVIAGLDALEHGLASELDVLAVDDVTEAQARRVAGAVATNVRAQDVVYRLGPATFGVVSPETTDRGIAIMVDRLLRKPMPGLTAATATFPIDGVDSITLLHAAERRRSARTQDA